MTKLDTWLSGGTKETYYGLYDSDGFFCAGAASLDAGESAEMLRFPAIKSATLAIPEDTREVQTGDDERQGFLTFASTETIDVAIQTGVTSQSVESDIQGINYYDDGQLASTVIAPLLDERPNIALLNMCSAKSKVFGQGSKKGWEIWLFNQGEAFVGGPDSITERTMRTYQYGLSLEQTYTWPWGAAMSAANEGTIGGAGMKVADTHRIMLGAFRTDGTTHTIELVKTIIGDHALAGAISIWSTVVATGVTTKLVNGTAFEIDTANNSIVFGTVASPVAPTAGAHIVFRYKWSA